MGPKPTMPRKTQGNKTKYVSPLSRGCPLFHVARGGSGIAWYMPVNTKKEGSRGGRENERDK